MATLNIKLDKVGKCHLCSNPSTNRKPDVSLKVLLKYLLVQTKLYSDPTDINTFPPIPLHTFVQLCENCRELISIFEHQYKTLRRNQINFGKSLVAIYNHMSNTNYDRKEAFDLPLNCASNLKLGCLHTMHIPENMKELITNKCITSFLTYVSLPELSTYLPAVDAFVSVLTKASEAAKAAAAAKAAESPIEEEIDEVVTNKYRAVSHGNRKTASWARPSVIMSPCSNCRRRNLQRLRKMSNMSSASKAPSELLRQSEIPRNLENQAVCVDDVVMDDDNAEDCSESTLTPAERNAQFEHINITTLLSPTVSQGKPNLTTRSLPSKSNKAALCPRLLALLQPEQAAPQSQGHEFGQQRATANVFRQRKPANRTVARKQRPRNPKITQERPQYTKVPVQQLSPEEIAAHQLLTLSASRTSKGPVNPTISAPQWLINPASVAHLRSTRPTKPVRKHQPKPTTSARQTKPTTSARARQQQSPRLQTLTPSSTVTQTQYNPNVAQPGPKPTLVLLHSDPPVFAQQQRNLTDIQQPNPILQKLQPSSTVTQPQFNTGVAQQGRKPTLVLFPSDPALFTLRQQVNSTEMRQPNPILQKLQPSSTVTQPPLNPGVSQQGPKPTLVVLPSDPALITLRQQVSSTEMQQPNPILQKLQTSSTVTQPPLNPGVAQQGQKPTLRFLPSNPALLTLSQQVNSTEMQQPNPTLQKLQTSSTVTQPPSNTGVPLQGPKPTLRFLPSNPALITLRQQVNSTEMQQSTLQKLQTSSTVAQLPLNPGVAQQGPKPTLRFLPSNPALLTLRQQVNSTEMQQPNPILQNLQTSSTVTQSPLNPGVAQQGPKPTLVLLPPDSALLTLRQQVNSTEILQPNPILQKLQTSSSSTVTHSPLNAAVVQQGQGPKPILILVQSDPPIFAQHQPK